MVIIDTSFHISYTAYNELPTMACVGQCKKSWWAVDLEDRPKGICPMCGGNLSPAVEGVHYSVLAQAKRELRYKDFNRFVALSTQEKSELKSFLSSGAKVSNLSVVKKAFEEKARREWCS